MSGPITTTSAGSGVTSLGTATGAPIKTVGTVQADALIEVGTPTATLDPNDYNVVVILLDDAGRDQFNWYGLGADYAATPTLDALVDTGVTFTRAYSTPICGPTRAAVQCGLFGKSTGFAANLVEGTDDSFRLNDELHFLPEAMNAGRPTTVYALGAFGKWHMAGPAEQAHPIDNGWLRYFGGIANAGWPGYSLGHFRWTKVTSTVAFTTVPAAWVQTDVYTYPDAHAYDYTCYDACVNVRDALSWINTRTKPFVCYLPLNPPHAPFERPPNTMPDDMGIGFTGGTVDLVPAARRTELDGLGITGIGQRGTTTAEVRSVFRAATECVDSLIGWMRSRMDPTVLANTVFIIWSDNGTVAQVIGSPYDAGHAKRTVYEQGVWAAAIIHGPPTIVRQPGREISHLVHAVDIPATVLEICKANTALLPPGSMADSISFMPLLQDPSGTTERDFIYTELFSPLGGPPSMASWTRALTREYDGVLYKLIRFPASSTRPVQLFRIDNAAGWNTGSASWLEKTTGGTGDTGDDYYPVITTTAPAAVKAIYADLSTRLTGLENSVAWNP